MEQKGGEGPDPSDNGSSSLTPANPTNEAVLLSLKRYLTLICPAVLGGDVPVFGKSISQPDVQSLLLRFARDKTTSTLYVSRKTTLSGVDGRDSVDIFTFRCELYATPDLHKEELKGGEVPPSDHILEDDPVGDNYINGTEESVGAPTVLFIKQVGQIDSGVPLAQQLLMCQLQQSPFDSLLGTIKHAYLPYARHLYEKQGDSNRQRRGFYYQLVANLRELQVDLLRNSQSIEVPCVRLYAHKKIAAYIRKCQRDGTEPDVSGLGELLQEKVFLDELLHYVHEWRHKIQSVMNAERDVRSGTTMQEIQFWISKERAIADIHDQLDSQAMQFTFRVLLNATNNPLLKYLCRLRSLVGERKKGPVYVYFDVVRDIPITKLVSAVDIRALHEAIVGIFKNMKTKFNSNARFHYPAPHAFGLLYTLSRDFSDKLGSLLKSAMLEQSMSALHETNEQVAELLRVWDVCVREYEIAARMLPGYSLTKCTYMYEPLRLLRTRISDVFMLRDSHDHFRAVSEDALRDSPRVFGAVLDNLKSAFAQLSAAKLNVLDVSPDGQAAWRQTSRKYYAIIDQVEEQLHKRIRHLLEAAKHSTAAMFNVCHRFRKLFQRPKIMSAIHDYRRHLITMVHADIVQLKERFESPMVRQENVKSCSLREIMPIGAHIVWAQQIGRHVDQLMSSLRDILGADWKLNLQEADALDKAYAAFLEQLQCRDLLQAWSDRAEALVRENSEISGFVLTFADVPNDGDASQSSTETKDLTEMKRRAVVSVNFSPEFESLFRERAQLATLAHVRIPHIVEQFFNFESPKWPIARRIREALTVFYRTYAVLTSKGARAAEQHVLTDVFQAKVYKVIGSGTHYTWDWQMDMLLNYCSTLVRVCVEFQDKVEHSRRLQYQVEAALEQLSTCEFVAERFQGAMNDLRDIVRVLEIKKFSHVPYWTHKLDLKVQYILTQRLQEMLGGFARALYYDGTTETLEAGGVDSAEGEDAGGDLKLSDNRDAPADTIDNSKWRSFVFQKPILVKIWIRQDKLTVQNGLESARAAVYDQLSSWTQMITSLPCLRASEAKQDTGVPAWQNRLTPDDAVPRDYSFLLQRISPGAVSNVSAAIESQLNAAREYVNQWLQYQTLWDIPVSAVKARLGEDFALWERLLKDMKSSRTTLFSARDSRTRRAFGPISVAYGLIQNKVNLKYDVWHRSILETFAELLASKLHEEFDAIQSSKKKIESHSFEFSSIDDIVTSVSLLKQMHEERAKWSGQLNQAAEGEALLRRQKYNLPEDWMSVRRIQADLQAFSQLLDVKLKGINSRAKELQQRILSESILVERLVQDFVGRWNQFRPQNGALDPADAKKTLGSFMDKLTELERRMDRINAAKTALDMAVKEDKSLAPIREELVGLQQVWERLANIWRYLENLKGKLFREIEPSALRAQLRRSQGDLNALPSHMQQYEAFESLSDSVKVYLRQQHHLVDLHSGVLRSKHHKQLLKVMGVEGSWQDLTVGQLWNKNLRDHSQSIRDILHQAQGEAALEDFLSEMSVSWENVHFELVHHRKGSASECFLIRNWTSLFELLGENLSDLQSMSQSPFFPAFERSAKEWEQKLNLTQQVLDVFIEVQRRRVYLEGIFGNNRDVQKQLAYQYRKFGSFDREFVRLMREIQRETKVIFWTSGSRQLLPRLEGYLDLLNAIQKSLGEYLEKQRSAFPRFYFVGDEDLLEIVGNCRNPKKVVRHFSKMFSGLEDLHLEVERKAAEGKEAGEDENNSSSLDTEDATMYSLITGFASKEGETVSFGKASISVNDFSAVHGWLRMLEFQMHGALFHGLEASLAHEFTSTCLPSVVGLKQKESGGDDASHVDLAAQFPVFFDWLQSFPVQVLLLCLEVCFARVVEFALTPSETAKPSGRTRPSNRRGQASSRRTKWVLQGFSQVLDALSRVITEPRMDNLSRKKCEQLVCELVHQRDVLRMLIAKQINSPDDYNWMSQLRLLLQTDPIVEPTKPPATTTETRKTDKRVGSASRRKSSAIAVSKAASQTAKQRDEISKCTFVSSTNKVLRVGLSRATFDYGWEYLGVGDRLVQTPLTDKCYLTLAEALHMKLGGNPFGPAGTGKTETVKALGGNLGQFVLVFNCDETFDHQSVNRILIGLCQCGAWGCFDEFNRLEERILSAVSQQILSIQTSLRQHASSLMLMGTDVRLNPRVGLFITMNPGYAGRSNLPDNLKQLFRSVAMIKPDRCLIAQVMMYAQGCQAAEFLAGKVVLLFELCKEQLSDQTHYDFGLRALKSVLRSTGWLKRDKLVAQQNALDKEAAETTAEEEKSTSGTDDDSDGDPEDEFDSDELEDLLSSDDEEEQDSDSGSEEEDSDEDEDSGSDSDSQEAKKAAVKLLRAERRLLVKSICSTVLPKLVADDSALFASLLEAVFPGVVMSQHRAAQLKKAVRAVTLTTNLHAGPLWVQKVMQLHEIISLHHGIIMVGKEGTGKTTCWRTLRAALELCSRAHIVPHLIDPKALTKEELFGRMDSATLEWTDGVFTKILRRILDNTRGEQSRETTHWIIFDGDVDPEWAENLNSVLDDNRLLTLPNGERLSLPSNVRLLFEVGHLKHATPATVSRCGMVWFSDDVVPVHMQMGSMLLDVLTEPIHSIQNTVYNRWKSVQFDCVKALSPLFGLKVRSVNVAPRRAKDGQIIKSTAPPELMPFGDLLREQTAKACSGDRLKSRGLGGAAGRRGSLFGDEEQSGTKLWLVEYPRDNMASVEKSVVMRCLQWASERQHVMRYSSIRHLRTLSASLKSAIGEIMEYNDNHSRYPLLGSRLQRVITRAGVYSVLWAFGGSLSLSQRLQFSAFIPTVVKNIELPAQVQQTANTLLQQARLRKKEDPSSDSDSESDSDESESSDAETYVKQDVDDSEPSMDVTDGDYLLDYFVLINGKQGRNGDDDFTLDGEPGDWVLWSSTLPELDLVPKQLVRTDLVVPTVDTARHVDVIGGWLAEEKPFLLCGPPGSGKSMTLTSVLRAMPNIELITLNFASSTGIDVLSRTFAHYCSVERTPDGLTLSPNSNFSNKRLVIFCDEINLPAPDEYGTQHVITFLRQVIEQGGFWRKSDLQFVRVQGIQFVGACNPPTDPGRVPLSPRFLAHCPLIFVDFPATPSLKQIYGTFSHALMKVTPHLGGFEQPLTDAMIEVYLGAQAKLTVDQQAHYIFSPRDLTRWQRAMYQALAPEQGSGGDYGGRGRAGSSSVTNTGVDSTGLCRLWLHEGIRLFADRLVEKEDHQFINQLFDKVARKHFTDVSGPAGAGGGGFAGMSADGPCDFQRMLVRPVLFSSWGKEQYCSVTLPELRAYVQQKLHVFNEEELDVKLVLFDEVLEHILRIDRVLSQRLGHVLLVGAAGAGKTILSKFVAWMKGMSTFQIKMHRFYTSEDFDHDLREVLLKSGCRDEQVCFIFDESNAVDSSFLERMNALLAGGEVPGLFEGSDLNNLLDECRQAARRDGLHIDSEDELYARFTKKVQQNLHVIFTMNPANDDFDNRAATSPALFNRCVIDWFGDWSKSALFQVGSEFTKKMPLEDTLLEKEEGKSSESSRSMEVKLLRESVVSMLVNCHVSVQEFMNELARNRGGRSSYVTPRHYLDLIQHYVHLFAEKKKQLEEQHSHLTGGLTKLAETQDVVRQLQADLAKKRVILTQKEAEANAKLEQMMHDKSEVEKQREEVQKIAALISTQEEKISERRMQVEGELKQVMPALEEAAGAVKAINKKDLDQVARFPNPPALVKMTMECVVMMLGESAPSWTGIRRILRSGKFVQRVVNFDFDLINKPLRAKLTSQFLEHKDFVFSKVYKASVACGPLVKWVRSALHYSKIKAEIAPMEAEMKKLSDEGMVLRGKQTGLEEELKRLTERIEGFKKEYSLLIGQARGIEAEMKQVNAKVERSIKLIQSLSSEQTRWTKDAGSFGTHMNTLVGDALLSAAFLTYLGYFNQFIRTRLLSDWRSNMTGLGINFDNTLSVVEYLSTPSQRLSWQAENLPRDELCFQNAIILERFNRYPLLIDPSGQAAEYVMCHNKERKIARSSFLDSQFLRTLETALRFGNALLVEDVEYIDPILNSVLNKEVSKSGGRVMITLGDKNIDFSPSFTIMLATRDPHCHFTPDFCSRVTFVNFTVTKATLTSQCLSKVLQSERPDIDKKRTDLLKLQGEYRVRLRTLEDSLLNSLSNVEGNILDDTTVMETLETLQVESKQIAEKMAHADVVMAEITVTSEVYRSFAEACSSVYFSLEKLDQVHYLYQFSLSYFFRILQHVLGVAELHSDSLNGVPTAEGELKAAAEESKTDDGEEQNGAGEAPADSSIVVSPHSLERLRSLAVLLFHRTFAEVSVGLLHDHETAIGMRLAQIAMNTKAVFGGVVELPVSEKVPRKPNSRKSVCFKPVTDTNLLPKEIEFFTASVVDAAAEGEESADPRASPSTVMRQTRASVSVASQKLSDGAKELCSQLTSAQVQQLATLVAVSPPIYGGIVRHMAKHENWWLKFVDVTHAVRSVGDSSEQNGLKVHAPHVLPDDVFPPASKHLRLFRELCVCKVLRPDLVNDLCRHFVDEVFRAAANQCNASRVTLASDRPSGKAAKDGWHEQGRRGHIPISKDSFWASGDDLELEDVIQSSAPDTPILLVSLPGYEPSIVVDRMSEERGYGERGMYMSVAMGSAEGYKQADLALQDSIFKGRWLLLKNVHLVPRWLSRLEKQITTCIDQVKGRGRPNAGRRRAGAVSSRFSRTGGGQEAGDASQNYQNFRLFLTMEMNTSATISASLIRRCEVVIYEPPIGLKSSLQRSMASTGLFQMDGEESKKEKVEPRWDQDATGPQAAAEAKHARRSSRMIRSGRTHDGDRQRKRPREAVRLYFLLCWLHAVILERLRYVPVGWSKSFEFGESDLQVACNALADWLGRAARGSTSVAPTAIPWTAIHAMLKDVVYGGRIDNPFDMETLLAFVEGLFQPKSFSSNFPLCHRLVSNATSTKTAWKPWITLPDGNDPAVFVKWVNKLPDNLGPQVLGLPAHADIYLQSKHARLVQRQLLLLQDTISSEAELDVKASQPVMPVDVTAGASDGEGKEADSEEEDGEETFTQPGWMVPVQNKVLNWMGALPRRLRMPPGVNNAEIRMHNPLLRSMFSEFQVAAVLLKRLRADLMLIAAVTQGKTKSTNVGRYLFPYLTKDSVPSRWDHRGGVAFSQDDDNLEEKEAEDVVGGDHSAALALSVYMQDVIDRYAHFHSLNVAHERGREAVWLGGLFAPAAFIASCKQAVAMDFNCSLEELELSILVEPASSSRTASNDEPDTDPDPESDAESDAQDDSESGEDEEEDGCSEVVQRPIRDSFLFCGLTLHGATLSNNNNHDDKILTSTDGDMEGKEDPSILACAMPTDEVQKSTLPALRFRWNPAGRTGKSKNPGSSIVRLPVYADATRKTFLFALPFRVAAGFSASVFHQRGVCLTVWEPGAGPSSSQGA